MHEFFIKLASLRASFLLNLLFQDFFGFLRSCEPRGLRARDHLEEGHETRETSSAGSENNGEEC